MTRHRGPRSRLGWAWARLGLRLVGWCLVLLALAFLFFVLLHARPTLVAGELGGASDVELERRRRARGLDLTPREHYLCWLVGQHPGRACPHDGAGVLGGDLGFSPAHGRPVLDLVRERWPRTLAVVAPALASGALLALILGTGAAMTPGSRFDRAVSVLSYLGVSAPLHWWAFVAVAVFALGLGWFPTTGYLPVSGSVSVRHLVLPIGVLALIRASRWIWWVRGAVQEQLGAPYVLAMRARGLSEAQVARHALRNAAAPVLTAIGHGLPLLVAGSVVIERVFVFPGMGALFLDLVLSDTFGPAVTMLVAYAGATLASTTLIDALVMALDPKERVLPR